MSVTMAKTDGVTVFTLTSDPNSHCPPLCQILKGLCYSPVCCSVSRGLKRVQRTSQPVLGALHIMVGLLNIGLGAILCASGGASWYQMDHTLFPYWFGGVFVFFGAMSILSEKCPSPCLVLINVLLNVAGVALAIASIVLYSINIAHIRVYWMCHYDYSYYNTPSPSSPRDKIINEKCLDGLEIILMLFRSMNALLIVLSVLELCVAISSVLLGIQALRSSVKRGNESIDDPDLCKPLLEEATCNPA